MKGHTGHFRGFYQHSRAWYAESFRQHGIKLDCLDEIHLGWYSPEGGTSGEFAVVWKELSGRPVPRLEVFDDAWHTLHTFSDLIEKMAEVDGQNISPDRFVEILLSLGFKDLTGTEP